MKVCAIFFFFFLGGILNDCYSLKIRERSTDFFSKLN